MSNFNESNSFNLFGGNKNNDAPKNEIHEEKQEKKNKITNQTLLDQFFYRPPNQERKISLDNTNTNKLSIGYKNQISEDIQPSNKKKINAFMKDPNLNLSQNNIGYAGFENNYGENSCFINVLLHFLYLVPCVNEYLTNEYKKKKEGKGNIINNLDEYEDIFLSLLSKVLIEYQDIISHSKKDNIIKTLELRQYLEIISNNYYPVNKVGDPVELLIFLFKILNKTNQKELHKYFFINLTEEYICNGTCNQIIRQKYDNDHFIYQICIKEILSGIKKNTFQNFCHQLFYFSKESIKNNSLKKCNNCGNSFQYCLKFSGLDLPKFLLINCSWSEQKPEIEDVIKILYMIPLEEKISSLFFYKINKNNIEEKNNFYYNLLGIIFYNSTLSHYIIVMFNFEKNLYVLYNDISSKELSSIHEVYKQITLEQIKLNPNSYYYPVLLIYYQEIIYNDDNTTKINSYNSKKYNNLLNDCTNEKKRKEKESQLTEEEKQKNYKALVEAQLKVMEQKKNNFDFEEENLGFNSQYKMKFSNNSEKKNDNEKMDIEEEDVKENDKKIGLFSPISEGTIKFQEDQNKTKFRRRNERSKTENNYFKNLF